MFTPISSSIDKSRRGDKISVIGAGQVGLAAVFAILNQKIASNIAVVDVLEDKLKGEVMDMLHASAFTSNIGITYSTNYQVTKDSDLVVITAGVRQKDASESRLALVNANVEIFRKMIPEIVRYSPNCCILVVSNPVDIMTRVACHFANLPPGRVFGSGTSLDTSRFMTMISEKLGTDAASVNAFIIGEHGDSSVAVWSSISVGGVNLRSVVPDLGLPSREQNGEDEWNSIHKNVITAAAQVIKLKGYTNWAIGLVVANISIGVLKDLHSVYPLSVQIPKGMYGIDLPDVFMSLPTVLTRSGVKSIVNIVLDDAEKEKLHASAAALHKVQRELHL
jgi:L-lactate dehydrogenase